MVSKSEYSNSGETNTPANAAFGLIKQTWARRGRRRADRHDGGDGTRRVAADASIKADRVEGESTRSFESDEYFFHIFFLFLYTYTFYPYCRQSIG